MHEAIITKLPVIHGRIKWLMHDKFLFCYLPFGRKLAYYDPRIEVRDTPWGDKKPTVTYMAVNSLSKKWERDKTYGGKIVENITQAVARDIIAEAMLRVEKAGYRIVLSVHDEILCEKEKGSPVELEKLMVYPTLWGKDIPLKAECWTGTRYTKG
jgi:DNA polymerase